ncbi:helix-turn-helix transcriptional regulator [Polymorphospora rubra]|uniref:helix-turn-helix transcriptional regulator n=1 Tax=Polymorphospora rubra TaxID=338584 RepID=UPI0033F68D1A
MVDAVRAWHPEVPLVQEVLHATFAHHAYPAHTHDSWTVLLIDAGAVAYDLDGTGYEAAPTSVTLLPPHVPHDGRSAVRGESFRKRVLYLDPAWLSPRTATVAAAAPTLHDARAVVAARHVHAALRSPADTMAVEHGIHELRELARAHLDRLPSTAHDVPLARRLRELLDGRLTESLTIAEAARTLGAHPNHLMRAFSRAYGIPPHRYVTGRRVDLARRLLLNGRTPAAAAVEAGFHDQSHLTRHFRKVLGTTPAAFVGRGRVAADASAR